MNHAGPIFLARVSLLREVGRSRTLRQWRPTISLRESQQHTYGIAYCDGPEELHPGETVTYQFQLMCWPDPAYAEFKIGSEIFFWEGSIVGNGEILDIDPNVSSGADV
jgi:hypothetical protein